MSTPWTFWIDVGGTFTDCIGIGPDGTRRACKVLSSGAVKGRACAGTGGKLLVDRARSDDPPGFYAGWRLNLLDENGDSVAEGKVVGFDPVAGRLELDEAPGSALAPGVGYEVCGDWQAPILAMRLIMGLDAGEELGDVQVRLGTTRGTNALLERKGARVALVTTLGFADVLEIGTQARPHLFRLQIDKPQPLYAQAVELDERVDAGGTVLKAMDEGQVEAALVRLRDQGFRALAVCLLNAYANPSHERRVGEIARGVGFDHVSISSELSPTIKILDRGDTAVVDAYLSPVIRHYVETVRGQMPQGRLQMMTSAGSLVEAGRFRGRDSLLSGPAGGVIGCAHVAREAGFDQAIGFDMGGTSTDVSRFGGDYEYVYGGLQAGVRVSAPRLAIETVAAGGGSICRFDGQRLTVGPDSGGADPGPACYGRGGPLTLTDVNFFGGRIDAEHFPFPLDRDAVEAHLQAIAAQTAEARGSGMSLDDIADGFVQVANLKMASAIAGVSAARGYDPAEHVLVAFGGAAGQHACAVAECLEIRRICLHPLAGVLSAYGIGMADIRGFGERSILKRLNTTMLAELEPILAQMTREQERHVLEQGAHRGDLSQPRHLLDLRYVGEDAAITVARPEDGDWSRAFEAMHAQLYGHVHTGRPIEIATARVEVVARLRKAAARVERVESREARPIGQRQISFGGRRREANVFRRSDLRPGDRIHGPALVAEDFGTAVVDPQWSAVMTERRDLLVSRDERPARQHHEAPAEEIDCDPVRLELFNNHFAHIATQMGHTLQRTAVSVNVKERLDFSCAVLDADGELVVNAPHIPVHLGAMGETVQSLLEQVSDIRPGDSYLTNDPDAGGSHLPDLTVMTPVFDAAGSAIRFFTASRAHHAEIGGLRPGSAYPLAHCLAEEGVVLRHLRIVREGHFDEAGLRRALAEGPFPSRSPDENVADVRAQLAANRKGQTDLLGVIERFGWPVTSAYMGHIRAAAAEKATQAIEALPDGVYRFQDELDDGAPLCLALTVAGGTMTADFTGTAPVNANSLNATPAIVKAALMYSLRCLIDQDIPLNAGVMAPLRLVLPTGMLNPPACADAGRHAAVVGGNVELSQKIVDVFFAALGRLAASQGTMNNLVFGNDRFGYYETLCGGAGAGAGFDGASAVHTHMTNTRLTDVEVLEHRFPVRLLHFGIRRGSGGRGRWRGGDGVIREIQFLEPLSVGILSQRRRQGPFGLSGGEAGTAGVNRLRRQGHGEGEPLGALAECEVEPGDVLIIETPGGGGFGSAPGATGGVG